MKKYPFLVLLFAGLLYFKRATSQGKTTAQFWGVWELKERKMRGQPAFTPVRPGQYKLFTNDGSMQLFQVTDKGTFITSYGTYRLLSDSTFEESFTKSVYFSNPKPGITGFRFLTPEKMNSRFGEPGAYNEEIWVRIPYAGDAK
ncbi:DUF4488 domain-containing protein [Niabella pedocola]|uniref:DUF4488 domain-containing protein n=1 Tax=Niabella pedocola TaxID=1752077 RepID=A0ABS8PK48_9BACT|nr:DUF4488 domain-containing protein [Niabella pedocola]MCD2421470.1 DUF4488 domain-containing protein [Niabella pedocola]